MPFDPIIAAYVGPLAIIWLVYLGLRQQGEKKSIAAQEESVEAGLTEPASLHPLIDPTKCFGCASCASACPEHGVLGLVNNKAALIRPSECIGHGACKTACPFDAITLVFGTETRGVDIPTVKQDKKREWGGLIPIFLFQGCSWTEVQWRAGPARWRP